MNPLLKYLFGIRKIFIIYLIMFVRKSVRGCAVRKITLFQWIGVSFTDWSKGPSWYHLQKKFIIGYFRQGCYIVVAETWK